MRYRGHSFEEVLDARRRRPWTCSRKVMRLTKNFPTSFMCRATCASILQKQTVSWPCRRRRTDASSCWRTKFMCVLPATRCKWKNRPATAPGGLIGTAAEGTLCHKPCTVSGGGKSEISKSISDAIIQGPVFVADFKKDFNQVASVVAAAITRTVSGTRRKRHGQAPHPQPGALARLGHQIVHAVGARIFGRIQRMAQLRSRNTSSNWCLS